MNTNAYNAGGAQPRAPQSTAYFNGGAKNGSSSLRDKVTFDPPRVPVLLKPEMVPTHPVEGKFGPQFRWEFAGNQVAWFDPDVHHEICACLEVSGCNEIAITKHVRKGQSPRYEVQGVDDQTGQAIATGREPARLAGTRELEKKQTRPSRAWPTEESAERETAPASSAMAAALIEAITACQEVIGIATANGIAWKPSSEDIRALAITIFIQGSKR